MSQLSQQQQPIITINIPATTKDPISSKWVNAASIYSYSLEAFTNRLYSVHDKNKTTVYQLVRKFREWNQVAKKNVTDLDISIAEFLKDETTRPQKVMSLYLRLRTQGKITKPPDKLSLPYTVKEERRKALAQRLQDIFISDLNTENAAYEILQGVVEEKDNASGQLVSYPFAFEIIAVPYKEYNIRESIRERRDDYRSNYLVGALNYSVSPEHNGFTGGYVWFNKRQRREIEATDIREVFEKHEFLFDRYEHNTQGTKLPCVIAANLVSPNLTYKSEGKSDVDINPYYETMVRAVQKIARQIKTFKAADIDTLDNVKVSRQRKEPKPIKKEPKVNILNVVEDIILRRIEKYRRGERFEELDTQDGIWYQALPLFARYKVAYDDTKSRATLKKYINEICEHEGVRREDIGIIAGAWATMYFDGNFRAVNFADMRALARNGTDIIFIEKGGMVEALKTHADRYGIALVNSHGHLTEYAKELAAEATDSGAHVAVVTDYDVPGLVIASKLDPSIPWLGINKHTIEHFDIPIPNPATKEYSSEEQRRLVVPYRAKKKPIDQDKLYELRENDKRFSTDKVDIDWLWKKRTYTMIMKAVKGRGKQGLQVIR